MVSVEASGYRPAAICRRGHVASTDIQLSPELASTKCGTCGAKIPRACPECNNSIRGRYYVPGVLGVGYEYSPLDFCEDCGAPFPWLSRQGRIYLLENMLDEEAIDGASRLEAQEQLEALANPDLEEAEQERRWRRVKTLAPGFFGRRAAPRRSSRPWSRRRSRRSSASRLRHP
jgi:hypothetical protein